MFVVDAQHWHRLDVSVCSILSFSCHRRQRVCKREIIASVNFNITRQEPGRASISLQTRDKQADAAAPTWTATRVTETQNILKCISLRCAVVSRTQLRIAENSMCVYEGWGPRGAAWDTDRHAGRGELICSSALSCSNTHNASVPWVASLQ